MSTRTLDLISVDNLIPDPDNPRSSYPKQGIKELAQSIAQVGQLEPIRVHPVAGGNFQIEYGHRRFYAIALLNEDPESVGYTGEKPILVEAVIEDSAGDGADFDVLLRQIGENGQRENLSPLEEARSYKRAIEVGGITMSALADRIGKNKGYVSKRLSLLDLPDKIHKLLLEGRITIEVAVEMAKLDDPLTDLSEMIGEIEEGYQPSTEEVVTDVRRALDVQSKRQAMIAFAKKIEAKGHQVLSFMDARGNVEKDHVITSGAEITPDKIPAKLPEHAVGVEVLGPERGRILLSALASEATPASVEVSEDDRKAAAAGDVAAQEKLAAKEKAAKQQKRTLLARVREERVHRLGFLSTVAAKSKPADVGMLAMRYIVDQQIMTDNRQRVAEILGLDPVLETEKVTEWKNGKNVDTGKTRQVKNWDKAIAAFLEEGGDRAVVKAAMAAMATKGEHVLAERSPGFEIASFGKWGYAMHLDQFDFAPLPDQPPADPTLDLDLDGPTDAEKKAPAKKAPAKKAPAKKATPKKAAAAKKAPAKKASGKRL